MILSSSFFVAGSPLEAVIACGSPWVKCLSVSSHTSRKRRCWGNPDARKSLDRLIGILQKIFDVFDHIIVYPLEGCLSADLFADGGKIFGSNTQLTRIIGNRTFFHLGAGQQVEESLE